MGTRLPYGFEDEEFPVGTYLLLNGASLLVKMDRDKWRPLDSKTADDDKTWDQMLGIASQAGGSLVRLLPSTRIVP